MMTEKMKHKLASRKFWALLAGFFGSVLLALNVGENEIAQIVAVITAFGSVVVYTLAEASVDKAAIKANGSEVE